MLQLRLHLVAALFAGLGVTWAAAPAPPRLDPDGERLPAHAVRRLGTARFRFHDRILASATTLDGRTAALIEGDQLALYDVLQGRRVRTLARLDRWVRPPIGFLDRGRSVAAVEGSEVRAWDVSSGKLLHRLPLPARPISSVSFAAQASRIAIVWEAAKGVPTVAVFDLPQSRVIATFKPVQTGWLWAGLSLDGRALATGGADPEVGRVVQLWDVATGKEKRRFRLRSAGFAGGPPNGCFSPDGKLLATTARAGLQLWETDTGKERWCVEKDWLGWTTPGFSPDGRQVYVFASGSLAIWKVENGDWIGWQGKSIDSHGGLVFRPDVRLAAWGCQDRELVVWDPVSGERITQTGGHTSRIEAVGFTSDGKELCSLDEQGRLYRWDLATGQRRSIPLPPFRNKGFGWADLGPLPLVGRAAFAPGGQRLVIPLNKDGLLLVDLERGKRVWPRTPPTEGFPAWGVAFSEDGSRFAAVPRRGSWHEGRSGPVPIWDGTTGKQVGRLAAHFGEDPPPLFNFGCRLTGAVALHGRLAVLATIRGEVAPPNRIDVSGWDAVAGKRLWVRTVPTAWTVTRHENWAVSLAVSPDGQTALLAGHAAGVALLDLPTGRDRGVVGADWSRVATGPVFSPDGRLFAVATEVGPAVRVVEWGSNGERLVLRGPAPAGALAFSPRRPLLASANGDTTTFVWDLAGDTGPRSWEAQPTGESELWRRLHGSDAGVAGAAIRELAHRPGAAMALLRRNLRPARARSSPAEVMRLIARLGADRLADRQAAEQGLAELRHEAEPALRKALADNPDVEVRLRLRRLLDALARPTPDEVGQSRCVEVLERLGSAEAKALLRELSGGEPAAALTRESLAAVRRPERPPGR